jgi:thiol-disulfide isomerase/thioredoxin
MKALLAGLLSILLFSPWVSAEVKGEAPAFSLQGENGMVNLADYKGKVVYLDFWASWCSPCKDSFPWMSAMQKKYKEQGVEFIAINVDRKAQDAKAFLLKTPAEFTVAFDHKGSTPKAYEVMGMPTAFLIDREGKVINSHIGFNDKDKATYEKHIQQALQQ